MKNKPNFIKTTVDKLQKGDFFKFGENFWDAEKRFHSYFIDNIGNLQILTAKYGKLNIQTKDLYAYGCQRQIEKDPAKIEVYIVKKFLVSNTEKHKGKTYCLSGCNSTNREYIDYNVNPINYI